jgi:Ni/Fe-hydrogenase 1 B-type cytochrome subunit
MSAVGEKAAGLLRKLDALGRRVPPGAGDYKWVYLWGWPIRAMHWAAVAAIVVLAVTGFYVGRPYFMTSGEAANHFLMGRMRFFHFAAAAVLVTTGIVRLYWMFAGNKFERLLALFPVRPRDWVNMFKQVKFYLMIQPDKAPHYLGHNPLQQLSYTGMYAVAAVMVLTGFTLYGQSNPAGFFYTLFGWLVPLLGGLQIVRVVHHVVSWAFLIFIPIHIYLALRADIMEHGGTISSIIRGGRFVPADETFVDE